MINKTVKIRNQLMTEFKLYKKNKVMNKIRIFLKNPKNHHKVLKNK